MTSMPSDQGIQTPLRRALRRLPWPDAICIRASTPDRLFGHGENAAKCAPAAASEIP